MSSTGLSRHLVALFIGLTLALFVLHSADAQCVFYDGPCEYKNEFHGEFSMWDTDDCETCFCMGDSFTCCSKFDSPVHYDPACKVFKDKKSCRTLVLDKHGNECETYVAIL